MSVWPRLQAHLSASLHDVLASAFGVVDVLRLIRTEATAKAATLPPRQLEILLGSVDNVLRSFPAEWTDRASLEIFAAAAAKIQAQLQRLPSCSKALLFSVGRLRRANEASLTTLRMQQLRRSLGSELAEFCSELPSASTDNLDDGSTADLERRVLHAREKVAECQRAPMLDQCSHLENECDQLAALLGTLVLPFLQLGQELKAGCATLAVDAESDAQRNVLQSGAEALVACFEAIGTSERTSGCSDLETALGRELCASLSFPASNAAGNSDGLAAQSVISVESSIGASAVAATAASGGAGMANSKRGDRSDSALEFGRALAWLGEQVRHGRTPGATVGALESILAGPPGVSGIKQTLLASGDTNGSATAKRGEGSIPTLDAELCAALVEDWAIRSLELRDLKSTAMYKADQERLLKCETLLRAEEQLHTSLLRREEERVGAHKERCAKFELLRPVVNAELEGLGVRLDLAGEGATLVVATRTHTVND